MKNKLPIFVAVNPRTIPGYDGTAGGGENAGLTEEKVLDLIKKSQTEMTTMLNSTVNSAISNLKKSDLPKLIKDEVTPLTQGLNQINETLANFKPPNSGGPGGGNGQTSAGTGDGKQIPPEVNAELKGLREMLTATEKKIKELSDAKEHAEQRAEETERHGKIRSALSGLDYASDKAVDTAFNIVVGQVKKLDDGTLVGGDNLPLIDWFKEYLPKEHPYLLKPSGASGVGASGGSNVSGGRSSAATTEMIRPGMTKEEREAVMRRIQEVGAGIRA